MSQAVMVKSDNNTFPHDDFGVWGIATEPLNEPYILWNESNLALVSRVGETETFAPLADAYWLTGYEYYFLALAPFNNGATGLTISKNLAGNQLASYPSISFTYDLTDKYKTPEPDYDFDLLGAAQYKKINTPSEKTEQNLLFWHLFSKIVIDLKFVDNNKNEIKGENAPVLKKMCLYNIKTKSDYQLSYSETASNNLSLAPNSSNYSAVKNLEFSSSNQTIHIVPQNISRFKLYVDFEMNGADYDDFEINLFPKDDTPRDYLYNNQYNWNITISPKQDIGFTVTVNDWQTPTEQMPPIDII